MSKTLGRGGVLELSSNRYGLALSWDRVKHAVDLDMQAVVVDDVGTLVDAVYYNRLEACDRALTHSGDEQVGNGEGFDETIWVNLPKVRKDIKLIIFVVAAHSGGYLKDAGDVTVHIVEKWQGNTLENLKFSCGSGGVIAIAVMNRSVEGTWTLSKAGCSAEDGNHFMDILEPTLGDLIRKRIKGAPKKQRVFFPMSKGGTADLPKVAKLQRLHVGVGWDMGSLGIDLDVSAVLFGQHGQKVGAVYYNNFRAFGVCHTGDNETGEGEGDDETITVELEQVPDTIAQIFFIVNIYSKDVTFDVLKNAYCRVSDDGGQEILRYALACGNSSGSGLIISRLYRHRTDRWGFQAIGAFCQGRKWMDNKCMKEMQRIFAISPLDFQQGKGGAATPRTSTGSAHHHHHGDKTGSPRSPRSRRRSQSNSPEKAPPRNQWQAPQISPARRFSQRMTQGSVFFLDPHLAEANDGDDQTINIRRVKVGVGWDILQGRSGFKTSVDLDVSAVFFHHEGRDVGAIDYENIEEYGVRHSGDNKTGEGEGDDEVIDVDLEAIPEDIMQIFFVVTVYTKGMTFQMVENAHCRVCAADGSELVRHNLTSLRGESASTATGVVIAQLFRSPEHGWCFKAKSEFCEARTWLDPVFMQVMKTIFKETKSTLSPDPDAPQPQVTPVALLWRGASCGRALGVARPRNRIVSL